LDSAQSAPRSGGNMHFSVSTWRGACETLVTLTGEIDISTGETVRDTLTRAMLQYGPHLLLDLSCVTFLDCAGLSALMSARRYAENNDGSFHVVAASYQVGKIAELTGLQDLLLPRAKVAATLRRLSMPF
jgi:anti-sigma B factor antagonist